MNHNQTRSYLKSMFILLGVSLLFTNCEREIAEDIVQAKKSRFNVQILNEKEVETNTLISKKLSDFNAKLSRTKESYNSQAREIYNTEYDFTINTDFVKYIEDTETQLHSYNFPLTRVGNTEDKIENLLLALNTNGEYSAFIVTYDLNKDEFSNSQEGTVLDRDTNYLPIDFDTSVFNEGELSNKMVATLYCLDVYEYTKVENNQGNLNGDTPLWTWEWIVTSSHCSWGYHDDGTGGGLTGEGQDGTSDSQEDGGIGTSSNSPTPDDTYDPTDPNNHGNDNTPPLVSAPAVEDDEENDCLPHFTCRPGELLDADCICQIDLDDPCANRDLINYQVAAEVVSTLESRQEPNTEVQSGILVDSFILETIDDGWGDVNQDKFSVEVTQLPNGYTTPFELFNSIRLNLNNLVVGGDIPYFTDVDFEPYSPEDGVLWNSNNPVGAAMDFETTFDTSTVYCVEYNAEEMYWVFATVTSYEHQGHFVSGIRQFGIESNGVGGYSFYVRAADRLGGVFDQTLNALGNLYTDDLLYIKAGDATWKNLMQNVNSYIQNNGGDTNEFNHDETYGGRHPYIENGCP